jgi:arylsulfatase A-like enzyme
MNPELSRRHFLGTAIAATGIALMPHVTQAQERPNILFLLTDDHRWDMMGCAGNPIIQTPNMDQLAAEGTRFTRCFANTPICCASRATIFTGLYSSTHDLERFDAPMSEEQWANSYPAQIRAAGYHTGFIGKWGLGGALPVDGFDYWRGFEGQGRYFPDPDHPEKHLTSIMGDQAVEFLVTRNGEKPFCLSISWKAPHVQDDDPRQFLYDPALEDLYADVEIPPPPLSDPAVFDALPEFLKNTENRARWERRFATPGMYQEMVKGYYRLITGVDRQIGRIREWLAQNGLAENTIIILTGDNGFFLGERGWAGKWLLHEESVRVPMIIVDPRIPKEERAATRDELVGLVDVAPTLVTAAGIDPPAAYQGESLTPLLTRQDVDWREEVYLEHHFGDERVPRIPGSEGIRTDRFKYIRYVGEDPVYEELYDLRHDPQESTNLLKNPEFADALEKLRTRWQAWRTKLDDRSD